VGQGSNADPAVADERYRQSGRPDGRYPGHPSGQHPGHAGAQYPAQPQSQYSRQPHDQYPGQPQSQYPGQPQDQYSGPAGNQYAGQPQHPGHPAGPYSGHPGGPSPAQPGGRYSGHPGGQAAPSQYRPPPQFADSFSDLDRRGRHATGYGQGFSWVLTWTILGALIPGTGLIAAGRRVLGGILLALIGLGGVLLVGLALAGNPLNDAISLAVDPQLLLLLAVTIAVGALIWVGIILATTAQLRRYASLGTGQRAFSAVVVLALIGGVALPAFAVGQRVMIQRGLINSVFSEDGDSEAGSTGPSTEKADPWASKPRVNVLLIGSDAGKGRIGVRPDTMIVASIDTKRGDAVLFSLPRNLEQAPFPEGTPGNLAWPNGFNCGDECLLNAVWTWGANDPGYQKAAPKNPGLRATKDAIEGVTGLKIDTYVMLNLKGFAQFVNAIGGLRVNVDERLPIGGNSEHPEQTTGYIEKGKNQKLDGYETLWFARSRWSTNDFDRMRRQRCVIAAVVNQSDPVKLALAFPAIAKAAKNNLSTGIPQRELEAWVDLSQRVKNGSVRSLPFTDQVITNRADPDYDEIHELVQKALRPVVKATPAPVPSTGSSATPTVKPTKKPAKTVIDPLKAQDVNEVC
jgi:LCP family protein required for cell wall assembly